jgi:hypothetical protein
MAKIAVIVLADTETPEAWGRLSNALVTVREADEADDEVELIFDGAGTKWLPEMARPEHKHHRLYTKLGHRITGACAYCARAYGVAEALEAAGIPLLDEYKMHPSLRRRAAEGFQIITF